MLAEKLVNEILKSKHTFSPILSKYNLLSDTLKKYKYKIGNPHCLIRILISPDISISLRA